MCLSIFEAYKRKMIFTPKLTRFKDKTTQLREFPFAHKDKIMYYRGRQSIKFKSIGDVWHNLFAQWIYLIYGFLTSAQGIFLCKSEQSLLDFFGFIFDF